MEKIKHAPGPWLMENKTVYALHQIGYDKNGPIMNNRFYASIYPDYRLDDADQEAEANAKLIAAAPELLEALIRMTEVNNKHKDVSDFKDDELISHRQAILAIKKATE